MAIKIDQVTKQLVMKMEELDDLEVLLDITEIEEKGVIKISWDQSTTNISEDKIKEAVEEKLNFIFNDLISKEDNDH